MDKLVLKHGKSRAVFVGDGGNDYCAAMHLGSFVAAGYAGCW